MSAIGRASNSVLLEGFIRRVTMAESATSPTPQPCEIHTSYRGRKGRGGVRISHRNIIMTGQGFILGAKVAESCPQALPCRLGS